MALNERVKLSLAHSLLEPKDEHHRAMLDDSNPEAPASAVMAHLGAHGLLDVNGSGDYDTSDAESELQGRMARAMSRAGDATDLTPHLERAVGRSLSGSHQYVGPALMKALSSGDPSGLTDVVDHAVHVAHGSKKIEKGVDSIFGGSHFDDEPNEKDRESLKDFISEGTFDQRIAAAARQGTQAFAEGGKVQPSGSIGASHGVATHFPAQGMIMSMAKGRINGYLNSIRPLPNQASLPFDGEHKSPEKERTYHRALDLANKPLSVLSHIKSGTLTSETMKNMVAMYPELYRHLASKITERIAKSQMDGEKPPYGIRQSLSLFLGAPLDSTMTPASMQSIQAVYAKNRAKTQADQGGVKKGTAKLGKLSADLQTPDQARLSHQMKG